MSAPDGRTFPLAQLKYIVRIEDAQGVVAIATVEAAGPDGVCSVTIAERGGRRRHAECWPGSSWVKTVANALRSVSGTPHGTR